MNLATFTSEAAELVRRNDRRYLRRAFRLLRPALARVGLAWSALVVAAFVLVILPVNMRFA